MREIFGAGAKVKGEAIAGPNVGGLITVTTNYLFEWFDPQGNFLGRAQTDNVVVNEGLDDLLDKYFKGSSYTADWYVGLITGGSPIPAPAAGDTLDSHSGWTEFTNYTNSPNVRQTLTLGTVSGQSVDNSASKASFTIGTASPNSFAIGGAFLTTDSAINNSSPVGLLYSAAAFGTGDVVIPGSSTLNVTATLTAASA